MCQQDTPREYVSAPSTPPHPSTAPREEVSRPSTAPREEVSRPSTAPREEVSCPSTAPREEIPCTSAMPKQQKNARSLTKVVFMKPPPLLSLTEAATNAAWWVKPIPEVISLRHGR